MESKVCHFPKSFSVGVFQKIVQQQNSLFDSNDSLTVNLKEVEFVELPALVYLLIVIQDRLNQNKKTLLNLPSNFKARNFFRIWQFPESLRTLTGYSFRNICTAESKIYFGEKRKNKNEIFLGKHKYDLNDLLPSSMIAMTVYPKEEFATTSPTHLASMLSEKWQSKYVEIVFERIFRKSDHKFSENIVFEAIANSLRHPECSNILVASSIFSGKEFRNNSKSPDGYFNLVIWDDGESIIETLSNRILEGKSIRNWEHEIFDNIKYQLKIKNRNKVIFNRETFHSNFTPTDPQNKDLLLLASIMPGISSNPEKSDSFHHKERSDELLRKPGMGLYLLTITSLYHFGGSVTIRTNDRFISVKNTKKTEDSLFTFGCTIENELPTFSGNMITIRLPIENL